MAGNVFSVEAAGRRAPRGALTMALLQIAEPGAVSKQRRARKIGVGIDLGTTNSLIAHFDGEQLCVMADESGETALPSVVHYGMNETLVGRSALEASQRGSSGSIA